MDKYIIEFIGTFFLVFTIAITGNPLAIGAILMAMVYMGANVSGGHYNPAVTLGVLIQDKIRLNDAMLYWISQVLGACAAAWVTMWLIGKSFTVTPSIAFDFARATFVEFLFTFALVSVVLNVAVARASAGNSYFGLAIGFTVMVGAWAVGPISGGAFNPAVALGPALVNMLQGGNAMQFLPIYLIGCTLGGAVAGLVFRKMQHSRHAVDLVVEPAQQLQNT